MGLVGVNFTNIPRSRGAVHEVPGLVKLQSQVARAEPLSTLVGDQGEAVAVLEVGLSDDVAFESRRSRDAVVTTAAQGEDQFRTTGHIRSSGRQRRRGASTRRGPIVVQCNGTRLR